MRLVFLKDALVPLLLRLGLAAVFVYHGAEKISPAMGHGTAWNPGLLPAAQAAVAWGEFLGGIALAVGFLPRLAALGEMVIQAGAIATVHGPHGFSILKHGWEYNFILIVVCLAVVVLGSGPVGISYWLLRRKGP